MRAIFLFMTVGLLSGLLEGKKPCAKTSASACASTEPRCPLGFMCANEQCVACPPGYAGPTCENRGCVIAFGTKCTSGALFGDGITILGVIGACSCASGCGIQCCFDAYCSPTKEK